MATYIKLKIMPYKWLLKSKSENLFVNSLIPQSEYHKNQNIIKEFYSSKAITREKIRSFCEEKSNYSKIGVARGDKKYKYHVVKEFLLFYCNHIAGVEKEALAADLVALKIAGNVTNKSGLDNIHLLNNDAAQEMLKNSFVIRINSSKAKNDDLSVKYQTIVEFLGQPTFFTAHNHDSGALISVQTKEESFQLAFDEGDLERILNSVSEYIDGLV